MMCPACKSENNYVNHINARPELLLEAGATQERTL